MRGTEDAVDRCLTEDLNFLNHRPT